MQAVRDTARDMHLDWEYVARTDMAIIDDTAAWESHMRSYPVMGCSSYYCDKCMQKVDPADKHCRFCGRKLVKA